MGMGENIDDYIGKDVPPEILTLIDEMKGKRSLIVVNHIKEHGYVTNEQLLDIYGYGHGPRAVKDARDRGIPIKTVNTKSPKTGRTVAAYVFDDISQIRNDKLSGRKPLDKRLKDELSQIHGEKCSICHEEYELRYLQTDHRVPYDIVGENSSYDYELDKYMLLCGSCNRSKSWSCEQCTNFLNDKDEDICKTCYWAAPNSYEHIATKVERRSQLVFSAEELELYNKLLNLSRENNKELNEIINDVLKQAIQ